MNIIKWILKIIFAIIALPFAIFVGFGLMGFVVYLIEYAIFAGQNKIKELDERLEMIIETLGGDEIDNIEDEEK